MCPKNGSTSANAQSVETRRHSTLSMLAKRKILIFLPWATSKIFLEFQPF